MLFSRIEMWSWDLKDKYFKRSVDSDDDKLPVFRDNLKIFTTFAFRLVFRISEGVPWDISVTSKRKDAHNFQVLPVKLVDL